MQNITRTTSIIVLKLVLLFLLIFIPQHIITTNLISTTDQLQRFITFLAIILYTILLLILRGWLFRSAKYKNNHILIKWHTACIENDILYKKEAGGNTGVKITREILPITATGRNFIEVAARGWSVQSMLKVKDGIETSIGMHVTDIAHPTKGGSLCKDRLRIFYSKKGLPEMIYFREVPLAAGVLCFGYSLGGWVKREIDNTEHFLVFAKTGYGKSVQLGSLIVQAYLTNLLITMLLIDFKGGETFEQFRGAPNLDVATNMGIDEKQAYQNVIKKLRVVLDIMKFRQQRNAQASKQAQIIAHPPLFIVVDEAASFLRGWNSYFYFGKKKLPSYQMQCNTILRSIAEMGRSTNIHIFIGTQRPDANCIDPVLRENLTVRIGGSTGSKEASKMIVNTEYLYRMETVKGRMVYLNTESGALTKMQCPFIDMKGGEAGKILRRVNKRSLTSAFSILNKRGKL